MLYPLLMVCCHAGLCAQTAAAMQDTEVLRSQVEQFLRAELGSASEMQVSVAALEPSLRLAACDEPLFTLPGPAADLRGSVRVSVRCNQPQVWTLYISAKLQETPDRAALKRQQARTVPLIKAGQSVTLLSIGPGFRISSEGRALANANNGQLVQVRTSSGQLVNGSAMPGGVVELAR